MVGDLQPDITFLFLVAAKEGLARIIEKRGAAPDRMEQEALDFHERVCDGYGKLAAENPERIVVLDGMRPITDLQAEVRNRLIPFLSREDK